MENINCEVCFQFEAEDNRLPDGTIICDRCWSIFQDEGHTRLCGRFGGFYFCFECKQREIEGLEWEDDSGNVIEENLYTS